MSAGLPIDILSRPRWRVAIRPDIYKPERIATLSECIDLVDYNAVKMRGWDYPYLNLNPRNRDQGKNWVASWINDSHHLEYWRFFQSGQFIHLFALAEQLDENWQYCLKVKATTDLRNKAGIDIESVKGYLSFENCIYLLTEIFEFASRLSHREVYKGYCIVEIGLRDINGFALSTDGLMQWNRFYKTGEDALNKKWKIATGDLMANPSQFALEAAMWFFERFGWIRPNREIFKKEQQAFLNRSL